MRLKFIAGMLLAFLLATVAEAQTNSYGTQQPQGQYTAPPADHQQYQQPQQGQPYPPQQYPAQRQPSQYNAPQPPDQSNPYRAPQQSNQYNNPQAGGYGNQPGQYTRPPQSNPYAAPPVNPGVQPDQPVQPQVPTIERRGQPDTAQPRTQKVPAPPFMLSPQEQQRVDQVLAQWEQQNRSLKRFDCNFKRWVYDGVFGTTNVPKHVEFGMIRYATPDRGSFRLESMEKDGQKLPIEPNRAEHWVCNGKSVFEYNYLKKQVIEYPVPQELQGKAIANSPLPFLFGAEANNLKQRYFIRDITPADVRDQIWLEAYPRFQRDAANFKQAIFVINTKNGMTPFALQIVQPGGQEFMRYQFYGIVANDPWIIFNGDPFKASLPNDEWQMIREAQQTKAAQTQPPTANERR